MYGPRIKTDTMVRFADTLDGRLINAVEVSIEDRLPVPQLRVLRARHEVPRLEEGRGLGKLRKMRVEDVQHAGQLPR